MSKCIDSDKMTVSDMRSVCEYAASGMNPGCFTDSCKCQTLNDICGFPIDGCNIPANCPKTSSSVKKVRDTSSPSKDNNKNNLNKYQKTIITLLSVIIFIIFLILLFHII